MNRKLDGTVLTTEDLRAIAVDHGLLTEEKAGLLHAAAGKGFHGTLLKLTRNTRHEMHLAGRLVLDTSKAVVSPHAPARKE